MQDSSLKTTQFPCQKMKVPFSWKEMSQNTSWAWWMCPKTEVVRNTVKIQFSETELPCILYPRASFCRDIPGRPSPNRKLPGEFSSTPSYQDNQFFLLVIPAGILFPISQTQSLPLLCPEAISGAFLYWGINSALADFPLQPSQW